MRSQIRSTSCVLCDENRMERVSSRTTAISSVRTS